MEYFESIKIKNLFDIKIKLSILYGSKQFNIHIVCKFLNKILPNFVNL